MRDTCNVDAIAAALIELTGLLNSPRQDEVLLGAAGVSLDRALFPLLVRLSASPAMGVAQLADKVGRDPSAARSRSWSGLAWSSGLRPRRTCG